MPAKPKTGQLGLFEELATNSKPTQEGEAPTYSPCSFCAEQYLSDRQVAARYDISKATVWRWHESNPGFARRIKLSPGTSRWKLSDLVRFELKAQFANLGSPKPRAKGRLR